PERCGGPTVPAVFGPDAAGRFDEGADSASGLAAQRAEQTLRGDHHLRREQLLHLSITGRQSAGRFGEVSVAPSLLVDRSLTQFPSCRKVFTNRAYFDETGCLQIERFHEQNWCQL